MTYLLLLVTVISQFLRVEAFLYNVTSFKTLRGNNNSDSFGYSVLLQTSKYNDSVRIIVGSPGAQGALYGCDGDIDSLSCRKYNFKAKSADNYGHDLLGISLDGGDRLGDVVITCAPRAVTYDDSYFINGRCFVIKDGRVGYLRLPVNEQINLIRHQGGINFFDYAFAEAGFSLSYIKETEEVIIGAPGLTNWNGGVIRKLVAVPDYYDILPLREFYSSKLKSAYFGYSVSYGRFLADGRIIYVVGLPRANDLRGEVVLFERNALATNKITTHLRLEGTEMGSYFGASILVADLNGDGLDDLLVGAPTAAGSTWDEGRVFLYRNLGEMRFDEPILLKGNEKTNSRFGTVIVDLHNVALTSTHYVAIAAPYENGQGAVYIYGTRGTDLSLKLYQRIVAPMEAKGFGLGMSRGADINNDQHNDIAIGAYKSQSVFVYQSFLFVQMSANLSANVSFLKADSGNFSLTICVEYKQNNNKNVTGNVTYSLIMDHRSLNESINGSKPAGSRFCENITVYLRDPGQDVSPFKIILKYEIGKLSKTSKLEIPYSEGCGEDNICTPNFTLQTSIWGSDLVLGLNKTLVIGLTITNNGETGLQPVLVITSPENVALVSPRSCEVNSDENYECSLPKRFAHLTDFFESYSFDIGELRESTESVSFRFAVKSPGVQSNDSSGVAEIRIPVISRSRLYITGNSEASSTILSAETAESSSSIPFIHRVIVGNYGPSPYLLDLVTYVPQEMVMGTLIIQKSTATINDEETLDECIQSKSDFSMIGEENLNSSVIACGVEGIECIKVTCNGGYLQTGKTATIEISFLASPRLAHFHLDNNDDSVTVSSLAQVKLENKTNSAIVSTTFLVLTKTTLPFWIFFITLGIGLIILSIIIYILYKCGFFNRSYKKLKENNMKLIEEESADEETNDQTLGDEL